MLTLRSVGRGRSSATKITSLLNLPTPINVRSRAEHTKKIFDQCQIFSERNMKDEAFNIKLHLCNTGQIEWVDDDELRQQVVDVDVSLDGSWSTRGWSAREGIVDVCFEETGKVIDVILKLTKCDACKKNEE